MASITKRNSSYLIRVSDGYDIHGKQKFKNMTWKIPEGMSGKKAEKEARHQAALFEEKVRQGNVLDGNIKLCDFIDRWFKDYGDEHLRTRTHESYKHYTVRVNNEIGHLKVGRIKPHHLTGFYNTLKEPIVKKRYTYSGDFKSFLRQRNLTQQKVADMCGISLHPLQSLYKGKTISYENALKISEALESDMQELFTVIASEYTLSGKTILNYHRFLSSVLTWAVRWDAIPHNPAERVAPPKTADTEARYLDEEEIDTLLNVIEKEPIKYRTAIYVALHLGARRGEILGLKWSDINRTYNTIAIRRSILYTPEEGVFIDITKTRSSSRVVKVSEDLMDLLDEYRQWQNEERAKAGSKWKDEDWIFTMWNGRYMNPDTLSGWVHDFAERENLPNLTLHALRHTNASVLISKNIDIKTVSARLGHANTTTTNNIYTHVIQARDAAAAEVLDDAFSRKEPK